jgi:hypothetical protein
MAKPPESDEFVRDVIAAHLREGEELLWAGRPRQGFGRRLVLAYALLALCAVPVGAYVGYMASGLTGGPGAWVVGLAA